jgi:DNA-binding MarR family transcriptional regulator
MNDMRKQKLADLPPSAKLVFTVLAHEGQLTQKRIIEETRLSARTVRYALDRLTGIDAITEEINFADARQTLYTPTRSVSSTGTP